MTALLARAGLTLALLGGMGACSAPLEDPVSPERHSIVRDGVVYTAIARFDTLQQGYFTRIYPVMLQDRALDRTLAIDLVEQDLGPTLCEGQPLSHDETGALSLFGYTNAIDPLPSLGGWQILASCA